KTGTAQVMKLGQKQKLDPTATAYFSRDHAWFASFAPAEDPEIVVVVLNEHGGWGAEAAAPAASKVIEAYFRIKRAETAEDVAHAKWMGIGLVAVAVLLFIDYRWLQTVAWPGYLAALGLLAGVAFAGKKVLGARRWLQVGGFQIQPSEFVKLAVIVVLARWFT